MKQIVGSTLSDSKENGFALVDLSRAAAIEALHAFLVNFASYSFSQFFLFAFS